MGAKGRTVMAVATTVVLGAMVGAGPFPGPKEACAAPQKMSFAEDVMPIFRGR